MKLYEEGDLSWIESKYRDELKRLDVMWELSHEIFSPNDEWPRTLGECLGTCLTAAYVKVLRLYCASLQLARRGLPNEAFLCIRAIFEMEIQLYCLLISGDREEHARRWIVWSQANRIEELLEIHEGDSHKMAELKEHEKEFDDLKQALGSKWDVFLRYGPMMKPLLKCARDVDNSKAVPFNQEATFRKLYPALSGTSHGYDVIDYLAPIDDDASGVPLKLGPIDGQITGIFVFAGSIIVNCLKAINDISGVRKDGVLVKMKEIFDPIYGKY